VTRKIPQLSTVPATDADALYFEVAREVSPGVFNGESEKIRGDALVTLLADGGANVQINIIQRLNPLGAYNSGTTYSLYDFVSVGGGNYAYINATPAAGNDPPDPDYWLLISEDGTDAPQIFFVTAAPGNSLGVVGDVAVRDNGQIYEKTGTSTWTSRLDALTQSEGDARYPLRANNLSDLASAATARTNLGLGTAATRNVPSSGNASATEVVLGNDTRLSASSSGAGGIGLTRTFSSTTTAGADDGGLRLNNADPASATAIYISESTVSLDGQAALLAKIAVGNLVQVTDLSNGLSSTYSVTNISDDGSYRTLTVAWRFGTAVAGDFAGSVLFQWLPDNSVGSSVGGGASGVQYTYNDADPPTSSGQIRTAQASLAVATAIAINGSDANGDSASDVLGRLKAGAIFTISASSANYVRFEATADYASGAVAVTVRSEQGSIATGDTVFLDIISDAPSVSSGGGMTWQATSDSTITGSSNNGYFCAATTAQRILLPSSPAVGSSVAAIGINTGLHELTNGLIRLPNGLFNAGIRATSGNPGASIELICYDVAPTPKLWAVSKWTDPTHYELFDPAGYSVEALSVINAIEATGVTLTTPQKIAVNSRIAAFQSNSEWADLIAYYGCMGGTANAHAINWRSPGTNNLTYSGSVSHGANGIVSPGGTLHAETGIATSYANLPPTGWAMGLYLTVPATVGTALNWAVSSSSVIGIQKLTGGNFGGLMYTNQVNSGISIDPLPPKGTYMIQRISSTAVNFMVNSTISANISNNVSAENASATVRLLGSTFAQAQTYGSWYIRRGALTNTQLNQHRTDEVAYQTALSRN
jgi:hypothetical protein